MGEVIGKIGVVVLAAGLCFAQGNSPTSSLRDKGRPEVAAADDRFAETASQVLAREFRSKDLSYLLLDLRSRTIIAKRWQQSGEAIPIGSLVKPFTAAAYAETHRFRFPEFTCTPGACWYPQGHGRMNIVRAIAFSCNAYFVQLAREVSAAEAVETARRVGLQGPPPAASAEALAGKYGVWKESPKALARAYAELLARREQPGIREIVTGMKLSAREGTADGISKQYQKISSLAITGTAPCTHEDRAPGDGFTMMAWPADSPRYLILLRYHGNPGSHAAVIAGNMLAKLQP